MNLNVHKKYAIETTNAVLEPRRWYDEDGHVCYDDASYKTFTTPLLLLLLRITPDTTQMIPALPAPHQHISSFKLTV